MPRQVRTSSAILLTLAAVLVLLGIGLCGKPSQGDDFTYAAEGAFALFVALILAIVGFAKGLFSKDV